VTLLADASSTGLEAALVAMAGFAGVLVTVHFQQRNRKADTKKTNEERSIVARVADTEAALRAWDDINRFQADQIKQLIARVDDLERQIETYQATISHLLGRIEKMTNGRARDAGT
jgi:uncharacterized protein HemX